MSRVITLGEIMMRLSPPGKQRLIQATSLDILYSGAEANVSGALAQWKVSSAHITCFPDHELGYAATGYWKKLGVDMQYTQFTPERLGLYFVENGAMMRPAKIVYDRLPSAFSTVQKGSFDWERILEGADWFHWTGITPALSQNAADVLMEALIVARKKGILVSADVNYRSNLWRYGKKPAEVLEPLVALSQVVVAGESDALKIFGIRPEVQDRENAFVSISLQLQRMFPSVKYVLCSDREGIHADHQRLAGQLWNGKDWLRSRSYDLDAIVERIGSGDAFIAGFIYGSLQKWDDQRRLDFATASAAMKHAIEGDINIASVDEIMEVMEGKSGSQIKR